ncbi:hypothetical protein SmJEL517_g04903 [Synchytrium microbalum]|uniref:Uncharacterized protein n=1 Tax=Synchytrium microbalum TaxID=1806994 RepID=A0A507BWQ4_9FUNG|nr:uncharacterized protein SmJEL517_g04903 [Synchytrium microbalum]TPX31882.1 hypothetical protein SmJEL517_g04903 [Synchytrium microbalum]
MPTPSGTLPTRKRRASTSMPTSLPRAIPNISPTPLSPPLLASPTTAAALVLDATSDVTLEMGLKDSPAFRAALCVFDDELEEASKWLDGLCKGFKKYADELIHNNVTISGTSKLLGNFSTAGWLGDETEGLLRSFSDALQTKTSLRAKLVDDLHEQVVDPCQQFLRDDVREIKEFRRNFDKQMEKYEAACAKHAAILKTKESSALREDDYQFYESRKVAIHQCLELAYRMILFKSSLNHLLTDQILIATVAHNDFYETSFEVFRGLKPALDGLKTRLANSPVSLTANKLEVARKGMEEESISKCKPAIKPASNGSGSSTGTATSRDIGDVTSLQTSPTPNSSALPSGSGTPTSGAVTPRSVASPAHSSTPFFDSSTVASHLYEKEGYLFKRSGQKSSLVVPTWTRRYFVVKNGNFWYSVATPSGKHRGIVMSTSPVNVLLCNIRMAKDTERRFCFEVYTSRKSFVLQAETEEDFIDWIETFQSAKYHAALSDQKNDGVGPKTAALIQEGMESSLPRSVVLAATNDEAQDDDAESDDDGEKLHKEAQVTPLVVPNGVPEEGEANLGDKNPSSDLLAYTDHSLEKKNEELHSLLKSVPRTDYVLDVYSCALQKDVMIQGRIFMTQNRICFHSNIVGFITVLVIQFRDVTSITRKSNPFYATLVVNANDATHTFKLFRGDDVKTANNMKLVWQNAVNTTNPAKLPDLLVALSQTKADDKTSKKNDDGVDIVDEPSGDKEQSKKGELSSGSTNALADEFALPSNITPPTAEQTCDCAADAHHEKREVDAVLNLPARRLFELLFGATDLGFNAKLHTRRGNTALVVGAFSESGEREVKYVIPVSNPMVKVTKADTFETQKIVRREEHLVYVIETKTKTPELPYADAFTPHMRYCITWVSATSCRLVITYGVKFHKSPMVKSLIKSAAMKGLSDTALAVLTAVRETTASGTPQAMITQDGMITSSSSPVLFAASSNSPASPAMSSNVDQPWSSLTLALTGCLVLSLLLHIVSWWRRTPLPILPKVIVSSSVSTGLESSGFDWYQQLFEQAELGFTDRPVYERTIGDFLSNHFKILTTNTTSSTPRYLTTQPDYARTARRHYITNLHRDLHSHLSSSHHTLLQVRQAARHTLEATNNMEANLIRAWLSNWVAEQLDQCRNGDLVNRMYCDGLTTLVKDMDVVW